MRLTSSAGIKYRTMRPSSFLCR